MLFTIEIKGKQENDSEVEIYLDDEGIQLLLNRLELLKTEKGHDHFMTEAWAGNELTEKKVVPSNILVNHLRITIISPSNA